MNIIQQLINHQNFTPTEQSINTYILENIHSIAKMSIQQLALATHSSNAAIIRICKKIGYKGYKDFKLALAIELESQKFINHSVDFSTPFYQSENYYEIINDISSLYKETINIVQAQLNINHLERISQLIINSQRIFIFAIGDSRITAMTFINKLMKINIYPILATENYAEIAMAYNMTPHDCAFFMTYNGTNNQFKTCAQILKRKNIPMITITANKNSRLVDYSDICIVIPDMENDYKIGTFYSQISFQFILTVLYSFIYKYDYMHHHQHKKNLDFYIKK